MAWPGGIGGLANYRPSVLDTVGWVIRLVKIVPDMTYNVFEQAYKAVLEREVGRVDLEPVIYRLVGQSSVFILEQPIPGVHTDVLPCPSALRAIGLGQAQLQGVTGSTPAHSWAHNLLSLPHQSTN